MEKMSDQFVEFGVTEEAFNLLYKELLDVMNEHSENDKEPIEFLREIHSIITSSEIKMKFAAMLVMGYMVNHESKKRELVMAEEVLRSIANSLGGEGGASKCGDCEKKDDCELKTAIETGEPTSGCIH